MSINKTNKRYLRIGAAALAAGLTLGTAAAFALLKPEPTSYTVSSEEGGYYSETTYYLTEETYNGHAAKATKNTGRQMSAASTSSAENTEDEEFVVGATKTVWVKETTDEEGNVTESRLLNKDEVEELRSAADNLNLGTDEDPEPTTPDAVIPYRPIGGGGGGNPETLIGSDNDDFHLLSIDFAITYNTSTKTYSATANASWEEQLVFFWETAKAAEEFTPDLMGITWGGDKHLKAQSYSISGNYYSEVNGTVGAVDCSRSTSDIYAGYVWQFFEKSGIFGKELELVTATTDFKQTGELQNKYTSAKLTYVHTYDRITGQISINVSKDPGIAASIGVTGSGLWQVELEIPDILY